MSTNWSQQLQRSQLVSCSGFLLSIAMVFLLNAVAPTASATDDGRRPGPGWPPEGSNDRSSGWREDPCECNCERWKLVPLYTYMNEDTGTYLYTIDKKDPGVTTGGYNFYEGILALVFKTAVPGTQPVYRFYNPENPVTNNYYYTTDLADLAHPELMGYAFDQVEFYIDVLPRCTGEEPMYHYIDPETGEGKGAGVGVVHVFTTNSKSRATTTTNATAAKPQTNLLSVFLNIIGYVFPPPKTNGWGWGP